MLYDSDIGLHVIVIEESRFLVQRWVPFLTYSTNSSPLRPSSDPKVSHTYSVSGAELPTLN